MAQVNPVMKPAAAPRDIKAVSKAFNTALEAVPEDQRPAVAKAVILKFQADAKAEREKMAAARAKAKIKVAADKAKAQAKLNAAPKGKGKPAPKPTRKRAIKAMAPSVPSVPANGSIPAETSHTP